MSASDGSKTHKSNVTMTKLQWAGLVGALIVFILPWVVEFPGLSEAGHRVFSIFLLAIVLWVTEAIPLHATAAVIIFLEIILISNKSVIPLPEGFTGPAYGSIYAALANPVLMLFLGGFFLADGAAKYKLDRNLARIMLKPFGDRPGSIMLGLMLITALLSMFMSNTATTATMMAVVLPVVATLKPEDRMKTGLALCIPFAANIGGIGTPVGTPPNAIALGAMAEQGISVSFVQWMMMAVPIMLLLLLASWQILLRMFPTKESSILLEIKSTFDTSRHAIIFYVIAGLTIFLWLTEPLHHTKSTIVGFIPVVGLLATRVFSTRDLQAVQWHVLWLVAGGIALGVGVTSSGLDTWLVGLIEWESIGVAWIAALLCIVALVLSTVISNSATANLMVPIGMSLALSGAVDISPLMAAFFIAIGASLAMALPISTPPNAIAYSTGAVQTKHMATAGLVIGALGWLLFVQLGPVFWNLTGLLPQ